MSLVEEHLTPEQIAQKAAVEVTTVYRWIKKGRFRRVRKLGKRLVRVPATEVNRFLESCEVSA